MIASAMPLPASNHAAASEQVVGVRESHAATWAPVALPLGGRLACDGGALHIDEALIDVRTYELRSLIVSLPYQPWFQATLTPHALRLGADGTVRLPLEYTVAQRILRRIRPGKMGGDAAADIMRVGRRTRVEASLGLAGRPAYVLADPSNWRVTELAIQPKGIWPRAPRLVPIERVCWATPGMILLDVPFERLLRFPPYRSDEQLAAAVRRAFDRCERLRNLQRAGETIDVQVQGGMVTLAGNVGDLTIKQMSGQVAVGVPGVRGVRNQLVCDDDIDVAVAQALAAGAELRTCALRVRTLHGVVHLDGMVPSARLWTKAALIARSVPGVREVRNEVAVAEQVPMAQPGAPMTSAAPATSDGSAPMAVVVC
jgi:osmotically-inducible protein OsmY